MRGTGTAMGAAGRREFVARGPAHPNLPSQVRLAAFCTSFEDPSSGETAGRAVPHKGNWIRLAKSCTSLHLWCRCVTCRREQQKNLARLCWPTVSGIGLDT